MSDAIQIMPSADKPIKAVATPTAQTGENTESADGFTAVFTSYIQSEPGTTNVPVDEELVAMLAAMLPQEMLEDGKMLPQQDMEAIWQAYLQLQPGEMLQASNRTDMPQQIPDVLNGRKPTTQNLQLNAAMLQPVAAQIDTTKNLSADNDALMQSIAKMSALRVQPEMNQTVLLGANDQLVPVHANNTSFSTALGAVGLGTATQAAMSQSQIAMPLNMGQPGWDANLANRLQMMVGQNIQSAEIRLDPPELGLLDIKIKVNNDVTSVSFTSPHAQVKDAIETAVPRLREMFAESGLSLGDVNVQQEAFAQSQDQADDESGQSAQFSSTTNENEEPSVINRKIVSNNLLDTYA